MQPRIVECKKCKTQPELKALHNHCCWLWHIRAYYLGFWENPGKTAMRLGNKGVVFFADLGEVVREYIMLQMCRLMDPPETPIKGGPAENLTLKNLLKTLPLSSAVKSKVQQKVNRMEEICIPLREARNKIIAHMDKQTALANKSLGILKHHDEYQEWFDLLQDIVDEMHRDLHDDWPLPMVSAPAGGLDDLLVTLRSDWRRLDELDGKPEEVV